MNASAQLLFATKGFRAFANNIIECPNHIGCYVCRIKEEHLNRVSTGHKVQITWDYNFMQGVDPNYVADSTYDAMQFIEKLIPRLAQDCSANHVELYPLLLDIFKVEKDFKLTVVTIIDPALGKLEKFSDQIRMRLDHLQYNNKLANLILVELPNKNKVF